MEYRKVLEIGFGGNPIVIKSWHPEALKRGGFITSEEALHLFLGIIPQGIVYHGVDFPGRLQQAEAERYPMWCRGYIDSTNGFLKYYTKMNPKPMQLVVDEMDARQLAYPDNSFHEVHMHYVISDPSVTPEDSSRILSEARRVLRPAHGLIVSGEKFRVVRATGELRLLQDETKELIREAGMRIDDSQDSLGRATVFHDVVRQLYNMRNDATDYSGIDPEAYLIVAWKVS